MDACTLTIVAAVAKSIDAYSALDPRAAASERQRKVLWLHLFDGSMYPGRVNFEKLLVFPRHGSILVGCYMVLRFCLLTW